MEITRTSVPGAGMMHHCVTRSGAHFGVLEDQSGGRKLFVYGPSAADDLPVSDEELALIDLDEDEADHAERPRQPADGVADLGAGASARA